MLDVKLSPLGMPESLLVKMKGQLGIAEADDLERRLRAGSAQHAKLVVFDMQELTLLASIGIGTLMAFQKGVHRLGGKVRYAVNPAMRLIFERAHLHKICDLHNTLDEACTAVVADPAPSPTP